MSKTSEDAMGAGDKRFPADPKGIDQATPPKAMFLEDGDHFDLTRVRIQINDAEVRMLVYNRSIPGRTWHVKQGSKVTLTTANYL